MLVFLLPLNVLKNLIVKIFNWYILCIIQIDAIREESYVNLNKDIDLSDGLSSEWSSNNNSHVHEVANTDETQDGIVIKLNLTINLAKAPSH